MTDLAINPSPIPFRLSDQEKNEIIAKRLAGIPVKDIVQQHGVDAVTVWRLCKDLKSAASTVAQTWRDEQVTMAVQSVNRALVDDSDNYKSAGIAVQALKGLGVYAQDNQVQVNLANWLGNRPAGCDDVEALATDRDAISCTVTQPTVTNTTIPSMLVSLHNTSTETLLESTTISSESASDDERVRIDGLIGG